MNKPFNPENAITSIKRFLAGKLDSTGLTGYVMGLSGGIDSSLSARLAVEAVGTDRLFCLIMPYRTSAADSTDDAKKMVNLLGIDHEIVDISPMIDAYFPKIDDSVKVRAGNKMARERMSILFDYAFKLNRLVLGTGNRTEAALGYTTLYGDNACSVNAIGQLYKTEVRQLAKMLDIPQNIIDKPPSADLWKGQTDEGEIGVTYEEMDRLLARIIDEGERSMKKLVDEGFKEAKIKRVVSLINRNSFKRRLPEIASLGKSSIPDSVQLES